MKNIKYFVIIFLLVQYACGTKKSNVINENEKIIKSIKELTIFKPDETIIQALKSKRDSIIEEKFVRYRIYTKNKKVLEFIQNNYNGELREKRINTLGKNGTLKGGKKYNSDGDIIETWKFSYDKNGNTTEVNYYDIDGTFSRRHLNKYDKKNNWLGYTTYDSNGKPTESTTYIYFENGNIKEKRFESDGNLSNRRTYEYDDIGNAIIEKHYKSDDNIILYKSEYDKMNNKVEHYKINEKGEQTKQYSFSYVYDQYGNWTTKKKSSDGVLGSISERKIKYYD